MVWQSIARDGACGRDETLPGEVDARSRIAGEPDEESRRGDLNP